MDERNYNSQKILSRDEIEQIQRIQIRLKENGKGRTWEDKKQKCDNPALLGTLEFLKQTTIEFEKQTNSTSEHLGASTAFVEKNAETKDFIPLQTLSQELHGIPRIPPLLIDCH